ncbi:MAG TPA: hemerythrin domain-containing protein, partial [Thermoanaerobaculia bacterium]
EDVLARLEAARNGDREINWFVQPIPSLIDFLTTDHRKTLGDQLPALRERIDKAASSAGEVSELRRIRILFGHLAEAITTHVLNEERELFPFISHLDSAKNQLVGAPKMRISQRVLHELVEHEGFQNSLRTLNALAERLPAGEAVSALCNDLRMFSEGIRCHMHLENNVLYPRAIEIENGLRRTAAASV